MWNITPLGPKQCRQPLLITQSYSQHAGRKPVYAYCTLYSSIHRPQDSMGTKVEQLDKDSTKRLLYKGTKVEQLDKDSTKRLLYKGANVEELNKERN